MNQANYDPITLEIIQNALQATSDEMFAALRKTAMSAIIYEVLDAGTGVTDAHGELASSGAGIPAFVGVIDKTVKAILREHPHESIRPGDVYATNDPWYGGVTHLNDMVIALPVFAGETLIAWTAVIAHWTDVGGMAPGSVSPAAREIWQEGLRLPAVKLFEHGVPIDSVLRIMKANSRMPDYLEGDLWASIAAVRVGERRLQELAAKYGTDTVLEAIRQYLDYGEQITLQALAALPHGRWSIAEEQDDGRVFKATVEIGPDHFTIDLTDNPDQDEGPNNSSVDGSTIVGQMVLKNVTAPQGVCNGGSFRPLRVLTREGSIFHATEGAAMGIYYEQEIRIYDVIMRCLAESMPERLPAGHFASICGTYLSGRHPDTGRDVLIVEPEIGGWGARHGADGINALYSAFHGDTFNCPAEICEARHGLLVDAIALNDEGGGHGAWRGGKGLKIDYRIRYEHGTVTCGYTRSKFPPWGLAGGGEGTPNYIEVLRRDGTRERYAYADAVPLVAGDVVRVVTGNGGGYGNPAERPRERVLADLRDGYISPREARDIYGLR
ncbi:hydantoinase B/oxoprolinase family protein [Aerosticca soli]|uniref:N-methylhydantoinase B n=1 Tax=Aerosticca soli TaxID=2010829 RepID=A0A2Z6E4B6_9GAMM|nr:hydantoinase B/oxoprolinase family protein [Aerosticca soli]MDI3262126.1 hydantoinase B/oxoprolinase family protein [Fulvimonas sp.]BBD79408.1 N-methylhydantoinase B [Aerosticca soli]